MDLLKPLCPECYKDNYEVHSTYLIQSGDQRRIFRCLACGAFFSQTKGTPWARLRTPLSRMQTILEALHDGMGVNAACRTFGVSKNSIKLWQARLAGLKPVLLLYSLCHRFLQQLVEGDELYTRVKQNKPAAESEGWTLVLLDRASRFLWELACGQRDQSLFERAMHLLAQVIAQTEDLTLLTDGERRYGQLLFALCCQSLYTGKPGRPKQTLPPGVKVRLKNKGTQAHRRGPKRPKYQAPQPEHPQTTQELADTEIHANHLEAFNSALRRKLACYRRRTNTYAKEQPALQRRLDVHWLVHNFVRPHFTTKLVPAVALGILTTGFSWAQLFSLQRIPFN